MGTSSVTEEVRELRAELRKFRDQIVTAMAVIAGAALVIAKFWL